MLRLAQGSVRGRNMRPAGMRSTARIFSTCGTSTQAHSKPSAPVETQAALREHPVLLYGVTGSGKTEVYMAAMPPPYGRGKTALVLGAGDRLDDQLVERFVGAFCLTNCGAPQRPLGRRTFRRMAAIGQWEARIAIGARSRSLRLWRILA